MKLKTTVLALLALLIFTYSQADSIDVILGCKHYGKVSEYSEKYKNMVGYKEDQKGLIYNYKNFGVGLTKNTYNKTSAIFKYNFINHKYIDVNVGANSGYKGKVYWDAGPGKKPYYLEKSTTDIEGWQPWIGINVKINKFKVLSIMPSTNNILLVYGVSFNI